MKFIKTYESFKSHKKVNSINEEFLGGLFGNLFKKLKDTINKTKGGKEVEEIYQKYRSAIENDIKKQANITLQLDQIKQAEQAKKDATKPEVKPEDSETQGDSSETQGEDKKESLFSLETEKIFENEEKISEDLLKKKRGLIDQIVKKNTDLALQEMEDILKKYGGKSANPALAAIISSKKSQFEIDVLTSQINALESSGDTKSSKDMEKIRDEKAKASEQQLEAGLNVKPVEYNDGDEVIYLKQDKTIDQWNSLSDEDKKNPAEGKASEVVAVGKIQKKDGDNFTIEYGDEGKTTDKTSNEIVSKNQVDKNEEAKKAAESLGKIKDDSEKMKTVADLADMLQDDSKKDKVEEIKKIMSDSK
jgi:hypothetical protein